jgi:hypothetical protein
MAPGGPIGGGSVPSRRRWAGEQGRAVGCCRHGVGVTDRWGRTATGPGGQRWGAGESGREKPCCDGAPTSGPGWHSGGRCGIKVDLKLNPNSNA